MKKLLAFLMIALVTGAALFAGPVHINGPGVIPVNFIGVDFTVAAEPVFMDGYVLADHEESYITGSIAGDFRGIIMKIVFSGNVALTVETASVSIPNKTVLFGAANNAQEVTPFMGSTRPMAAKTLLENL